MQKNARKPSTDPVQERLREDKAKWNKEVSLFVNDLIHLKKMMNGWPSKFHMERSFIKDPIPADPATIIGSLAGDFNELAQKGSAIVEEQLNYSKNRKKRQMKQLNLPAVNTQPTAPGAPAAPPAGPDLSQQLSLPSVASMDYALLAQASNPITRFFTKLFNPTAGFGQAADIRRARIAMLEACAQGYRNLGKFQVMVVKSSAASVHDANAKLHECWTNWTLVSRAYVLYKNSVSLRAPDKGGSIEHVVKEQDAKEEKELDKLNDAVQEFTEQSKAKTEEALDKTLDQDPDAEPSVESPAAVETQQPTLESISRLELAKNIASDAKRYIPQLPITKGKFIRAFEASLNTFISSRGKVIPADLFQAYTNAIIECNNALGTKGSSFKHCFDLLRKQIKMNLKDNQITPPSALPEPITPPETQDPAVVTAFDKTSQDFAKKWIGKTVHQLSLFDKTSPYRLNCFRVAGEIRVELNQLMNLLEKGLDQEQVEPLVKSINAKYLSLRGMMRSMNMAVGGK